MMGGTYAATTLERQSEAGIRLKRLEQRMGLLRRRSRNNVRIQALVASPEELNLT
jgi:hypothetical protein